MIASVRLYRTTGPDRLALVSVTPGTAAGSWLIRIARGMKTGKLSAGGVFGPFPQAELEARFNEVVAQLKAEGFQTSGGQLLIGQLAEKSSQNGRARRSGWGG